MVTVDQFVALSVGLTGFDADELHQTGMAGTYRSVVLTQAGDEQLSRLVRSGVGGGPPDPGDEPLRELARSVTHLWYTGTWPGLPTPAPTGKPAGEPFVVSSRAYAEGLVWRAFGAHAPGTVAQGYGSWAVAPPDRHSTTDIDTTDTTDIDATDAEAATTTDATDIKSAVAR
ncbi:hypothetical protein [Kitasatospora sp. MAP5-34]|uniref:hypothetical protein n=1 Tax=Kitasatospora sp. MAP5-34 TaxID=3035102 RepID=UPI0024743F3C|nr:hypothetical protein [Kitasatospora sp. MAP5-34]MDH6575959.1 hypothetical protein [Kitasatospora sp. MAP5-34]